MKCWNCLHVNTAKGHRCEQCDQSLQPNAAQKISGRRHVEYLLHELESWPFLQADKKSLLQSVYSRRLQRLSKLDSKARESWPDSDWSPATVPAHETEEVLAKPAVETEEPTLGAPPQTPSTQELLTLPEPVAARPEPQAPPPASSYLERLTGEADIRWFHSLGALLVVAATVGWLRSSWDSYGRALTGLLIALSPILLHFLAAKLRRSVPLSARLLSILANVLTPLALLSLDVFDNLPTAVPSDLYWSFSMLVSSTLLNWQAHQTREKVPLYLGGLCCVMAGWSQGALATAAFSLGIGFLFQWGRQEGDPEWQHHRQQMSFYAGSFGALASLVLFETAQHPAVPLLGFTAALLFLSLPSLTGRDPSHSGQRLFLQTVVTVVGSILMRAALGLSPGGVALYLLFACTLFLAVDPESPMARISAQIASLLGLLALGIGFFSNLTEVLSHSQSDLEGLLRAVFSIAGGAFFFVHSRRAKTSDLAASFFLLSLLAALGGWLHLLLQFAVGQKFQTFDDLLPLLAGTALFVGTLVLSGRKLRESEQALSWALAFPLLLVSLALSTLGQLLVPISWPGWTLTLTLHTAIALGWERGWLAPLRLAEGQEVKVFQALLPRLVLLAEVLTIVTVDGLEHKPTIAFLFLAHLSLSLLLRNRYRTAAWEAAWGLAVLALPFFGNWGLLLMSLAVNALALSTTRRQALNLVLSALYGGVVLAQIAPVSPQWALYLPFLAFALGSWRKALDDDSPAQLFPANLGLAALFTLALWLGKGFSAGSPLNLLYTLGLAALCLSLQSLLSRQWPSAQRVLASPTPGLMFSALALWSLEQSTLETGVLAILSGGALAIWSLRSPRQGGSLLEPRLQVAVGTLLFGAAQLFTDTHFLLDPGVLASGVLAIEAALMIGRRRSPLLASTVLLWTGFVQQNDSVFEAHTLHLCVLAALFLSLQCIRQKQNWPALASLALFLLQADELAGSSELDLKLRALPLALSLVAGGLWRFRSEEVWPRPALRLGLALGVAPAFLQFAFGYRMTENFVWLLAFACAYLALHFPLPKDLGRVFRQAGGATLVGWVVVSLTRAALRLPWQAATLVIGLALVGIGVYVEKKRRDLS